MYLIVFMCQTLGPRVSDTYLKHAVECLDTPPRVCKTSGRVFQTLGGRVSDLSVYFHYQSINSSRCGRGTIVPTTSGCIRVTPVLHKIEQITFQIQILNYQNFLVSDVALTWSACLKDFNLRERRIKNGKKCVIERFFML